MFEKDYYSPASVSIFPAFPVTLHSLAITEIFCFPDDLLIQIKYFILKERIVLAVILLMLWKNIIIYVNGPFTVSFVVWASNHCIFSITNLFLCLGKDLKSLSLHTVSPTWPI